MKLELNVEGMHCKSCEILISDELEDTGAIRNISISYKNGRLSLDYNENRISIDKIKSIIKNEGYALK